MSVVRCKRCGREVLRLNYVMYPYSAALIEVAPDSGGNVDVNLALDTYAVISRPGASRLRRELHSFHECYRLAGETQQKGER